MSSIESAPLLETLQAARRALARAAEEGVIGAGVVEEIDAAIERVSGGQTAPRKDLLSVVCHDLKDPLASIVMGAGFLKKVLPQDDAMASARRVVDAIQRSADRMNQLILDFHDLGKLERGLMPIEKRPVDVPSLVRAACDAAVAPAAAKHVTIQAAPVDPGLTVACDRARILQALSKVIGNAIKFSPENGLVAVSATPYAGGARIEVKDAGRGIAPERLLSVFDREANMRQTPRDGPGLGLPIAAAIVALHGGTIRAESAGQGTTITIDLPA